MKRVNRRTAAAIMIAMLLFVASVFATSAIAHPITTGDFSVKEYDEFHHVLHPLEHEALPAKDFKSIRTNARELVRQGVNIVKLNVPRGTKEEHVDAFTKELKTFDQALKKFAAAAKDGTDAELATSFSSVHDSFETLASMLPRA
jgi:hypothetical protein